MFNPVVIDMALWGHPTEITLFGLLSFAFSAVTHPRYIVTMVKSKVPPPPRSSWFLYIAMDIVILGSQLSRQVFDPMMIEYTLGTLVVALFSLKYGRSGWSKFETNCSIFVAVSIFLYFSFGPLVATICSLAGITVASFPILKKVMIEQKKEDLLAWSFAVTGSTFSLLDGKLLTGIWFVSLQGIILLSIIRLNIKSRQA